VGPQAKKKSAAILQAGSLEFGGFVHGFSTRRSPSGADEDFNLGLTESSDRKQILRNRSAFLGGVAGEASGWKLELVRQIHSDQIHVTGTSRSSKNGTVCAGDGLITSAAGVLLAVQTADCVPLLIADPEHRAVGALHAGWRGTLARIAEKGVGAMRRHFRSDPADLRVAIGPSIRACCYGVSDELRDRFLSQFEYGEELFTDISDSDPVREKYPLLFMNMRAPGHGAPPCKPHLDLVEANRRQLIVAGVPAEQIEVIPLCTSCRTDLLFSHRAEKGQTGRMMAGIGMVP
jgi:YfiH family protein